MPPVKIEVNEKFKKALDLLNNSSKHLFITGKAGSGKSTLLRLFRESTLKNIVVLAPTGVAAVNVQGETIHSFFGLKPGSTAVDVHKFSPSQPKFKVINNLDTLVIDEVSMVRADLLDSIDQSLRVNRGSKEPFGGVQVVMFGDLLQLPPVVTDLEKDAFQFMYRSPYFFDAFVMDQIDLEVIELDKIYRQSDADFISILNKVRTAALTNDDFENLNTRTIEYDFDDYEKYVYLSSTNKIADAINQKRLNEIDETLNEFKAEVTGEFNISHAPVPQVLQLKRGSRIMMQNNDTEGRWINGSVGNITDIYNGDLGPRIVVKLDDGSTHAVSQNSWDMYRYEFNESDKKLKSVVVGSYAQFPIKLAWAVTIHKSQGKTFDKVLIDLGWRAFAHGQVYVALSRCTSFEGVLLKRPIRKDDIVVDQRVLEWVKSNVLT